MRENWKDARFEAAIDQLRGEVRDVQRLMLQGAFVMCVIVHVIGLFLVVALAVSQ